MFCLAKENEENGEQEADNEVDEEEEEGGEEEDEEEEGDGNFLCSPRSPTQGCLLPWTADSREAAESSISPSWLRPGGSCQPGSVLPHSLRPPVLGVKSALNPFQQVEGRFLPSSLLQPDGTVPRR